MSSENPPFIKLFVAVLTGKRLASVPARVPNQQMLNLESLGTLVTHERLHAGVNPDVSGQFAGLVEGRSTCGTQVRPVVGVTSDMKCQVGV